MVLKEWLSQRDPDEVIYLGCEGKNDKSIKTNGSGFIFIGHAKNAPVQQFGDRNIISIYPHETDYYGMTIIIDGMEHGKYWIWHECDPDVPIVEMPMTVSDEPFEALLMALARQTAQDYRVLIRGYIRMRNPTALSEVNDIIRTARKVADLEFLEGSQTGAYLIQRVEDEERIFWKHPKARYYPPEKRNAFFDRKRKELMTERVKQQEKKLYATIKGRSVKHDLSG